MALPAIAAVGARVLAPILGRAAASGGMRAVAGRAAGSAIGRMGASSLLGGGGSDGGGGGGGGESLMGSLDSMSMQNAGGLLEDPQPISAGRSECFGLGCSSS